MSEERCPRCGLSLGPQTKFCPECGLSVGGKPTYHDHDHDRLTWWERRPGWERALILVLVAAVIAAAFYFIFMG